MFWLFQSAPLTEARGDLTCRRWTRCQKGFNPLPSPKQGETPRLFRFRVRRFVSIRSPHRSKGRRQFTGLDALHYPFQSAPLTEARGDRAALGHRPPQNWFQSAPLTEARGDKRQKNTPGRETGVSIRSPHRSKGRRLSIRESEAKALVSIRSPHRSKGRPQRDRSAPRPPNLFQSAPLTEARGDSFSAAKKARAGCFNPLPSPKQGETPVAVTGGITKS